jgi:putative nucleotidyltransferase with HDIG domain
MTREEALKLLHEHMQNPNLRRHCYAVEAVMRGLARRFQEDEELWGIAGLLHDADYEETKDEAHTKHTKVIMDWLTELDAHSDIRDAIAAHGWNYVDGAPEPKTKMQWALYTCDELTGLIVATALVKPEKKLASVTVESIQSKWSKSGFAAGVDRKQIEMCESMLQIPLPEFIKIALESMQSIAPDLGL